MTIGTIIDIFLKYLNKARPNTYIRKPYAWALYQTWKLVDEEEKKRDVE